MIQSSLILCWSDHPWPGFRFSIGFYQPRSGWLAVLTPFLSFLNLLSSALLETLIYFVVDVAANDLHALSLPPQIISSESLIRFNATGCHVSRGWLRSAVKHVISLTDHPASQELPWKYMKIYHTREEACGLLMPPHDLLASRNWEQSTTAQSTRATQDRPSLCGVIGL